MKRVFSQCFRAEVSGTVAQDEAKTALINNGGQTANVPVCVYSSGSEMNASGSPLLGLHYSGLYQI